MPPRIAPSVWTVVMVGASVGTVAPAVTGTEDWRSTMDDATADYLRRRYWEEDELLRDLREDLQRRGPTIQVSAETGRLLAVLIAAAGARRVLEVGTLFGYSGVWIARALPSDGSLDTL